jgi:DNA-binding transcriptional LysR family regulator
MIQIHRLEGFYWVARCEGYARAARSFPYPITQPGVYLQVSKLEDELEQKLFERVGKDRVRLTPAGRKLHAFIAPFFEELPRVVQSLESASYGGDLRIDAAGLPLRELLPDWVRRIRQARPDIRVDIEEIQTPDLDRLRTGAADLVVDYVGELPAGYEARRIGTSYTFLALSSEHPLARSRRLPVDRLKGEPFVGYHPSLRQSSLQLAALERSGIRPARVITASSVDAILGFVRAGLGYSLVPWLEKRGPELRGIVTHRQAGRETEFPIHAVWRKSDWASPLVEAALELAPRPA